MNMTFYFQRLIMIHYAKFLILLNMNNSDTVFTHIFHGFRL